MRYRLEKWLERTYRHLRLVNRGEFRYLAYRGFRLIRTIAKNFYDTPAGQLTEQTSELKQYKQPTVYSAHNLPTANKSRKYAFVIHAHYIDVYLNHMLPHLKQLPNPDYDLFISVDANASDKELYKVETSLEQSTYLFKFENKGRDILPFLNILPLLEGYDWVCKLHTKKSTHLSDGELWREDLYNSLLSATNTSKVLQLPESYGTAAPYFSYLWTDIFMHRNKAALDHLLKLFSLPASNYKFHFIAGSMFWFRPKSLRDLQRISHEQYTRMIEPENAQIDGTYAHALERLFLKLSSTRHNHSLRLS